MTRAHSSEARYSGRAGGRALAALAGGTWRRIQRARIFAHAKKRKGKERPQPRPRHGGPWYIYYFQRNPDDDPSRAVPGRAFLAACPTKVQTMMKAVLLAVAAAPPPAFSGGGKWEAMHDEMGGFYEVRVDGPKRRHYRLFCLLERDGAAVGLAGPSIIIVTGKEKPFRTKLAAQEYAEVRALGAEYKKRTPRSVEGG